MEGHQTGTVQFQPTSHFQTAPQRLQYVENNLFILYVDGNDRRLKKNALCRWEWHKTSLFTVVCFVNKLLSSSEIGWSWLYFDARNLCCCASSEAAVHISYMGKILILLTVSVCSQAAMTSALASILLCDTSLHIDMFCTSSFAHKKNPLICNFKVSGKDIIGKRVSIKWQPSQGDLVWFPNSRDFELTEFEIARLDCNIIPYNKVPTNPYYTYTLLLIRRYFFPAQSMFCAHE